MASLLPWPILIPLLAGTVLLLVRRRSARTALSTAASALTLAIAAAVFAHVASGEVLAVQMADWPAPFGISLVADRLSASMLLLASAVGFLTVILTASTLDHPPVRGRSAVLNRAREAFGAQALLQFVMMGVHMSFLTGDLFNLFVAFEVMLIASYGMMLLGGELPQLREGFKYVVVNLIASAVFVLSAGYAYGLIGSLNLADMSVRVAAHGPDARLTALALVLSLVFAIKSAVFPLGFWLPDAYPTPPAAFSAFFAALLTKVGIYSLVRVNVLVFPDEALVGTLVAALGGVTILLATLGAIARQRWRYSLSFANVASIGNALVVAFVAGERGLAAALFYLAHSIVVIFALFAVAAVAERISGSGYRSPGHLALYPWLGVGFFAAGLTVSGMPPTSGFVGKFGIVAALLEGGGAARAVLAAVVLVGGFLLLYAMVQIWREFFWGESDAVHAVEVPAGARTVAGVAVALSLALAVFAGPVQRQATSAASQLLDGGEYRFAVLGAEGTGGFTESRPGTEDVELEDAAPTTDGPPVDEPGEVPSPAEDAPAPSVDGEGETTP